MLWMLDNGLTPVEEAVKDAVRSDFFRRIRLRFDALMASVFAGEVERLTDVRAAHP